MINTALRTVIGLLLKLRYRIELRGAEEIAARGTRGILFLPNHPALIDPIILATILNKRFAPRFLADQDQVNRPVIRWLAGRIRVLTIPDLAKHGPSGRERIREALGECAESLKRGENVTLYPGGHIYHTRQENLRGNSGAHILAQQTPPPRIVLVRTRGLWGSSFSRANGLPSVLRTLMKGFFGLLLSGLFFAPRRRVTIELTEPQDLPREADRETFNQFLESFYNEDAPPNTYVPYSLWEGGDTRPAPEPPIARSATAAPEVPETTRRLVIDHLREVTGMASIPTEAHLARDLGMDSLVRAELLVWLEQEFGVVAGDVDGILTVADLMRAASGETILSQPVALRPVPPQWFAPRAAERLTLPDGETITEVFLRQAARGPDRLIVADQASGARSYRDCITAIFLLRDAIRRMPGERIGIMLPASVGADVLYLATLFAGRTPVMVNWTVGPRNVAHSLDLAGVQRVLTAEALVARLAAQGQKFDAVAERFVFMERLRREFGIAQKIGAWLRARFTWASLRRATVPETAAVLFTSGSESLPKAVPLTHRNILANLRDVLQYITVRGDDRLLGILPPFHSFGLAETVILPLCLGMPTVYHPNPTESAMLARLMEAWRATLLMGTPAFLDGVVRSGTGEQLASMRMAVTGAEKCPERVYAALTERRPGVIVVEGYGITECSPIVSVNRDNDPKPYTIGRPLPSLEYAIVAPETLQRVARGERGMLLVRGPSVFGDYLGDDARRHNPFVEFEGREWYRTGDLVREDAQGVLTFCGRLKRFVKIGGEMISLSAVEAALEGLHAGEAEGPTIAVEAPAREEHPELVLFTTLDLDREIVNRRLREAGLSPLHNVRRVVRLEEIPVLGTGKTDYRALRERLAGEAEEIRSA